MGIETCNNFEPMGFLFLKQTLLSYHSKRTASTTPKLNIECASMLSYHSKRTASTT